MQHYHHHTPLRSEIQLFAVAHAGTQQAGRNTVPPLAPTLRSASVPKSSSRTRRPAGLKGAAPCASGYFRPDGPDGFNQEPRSSVTSLKPQLAAGPPSRPSLALSVVVPQFPVFPRTRPSGDFDLGRFAQIAMAAPRRRGGVHKQWTALSRVCPRSELGSKP